MLCAAVRERIKLVTVGQGDAVRPAHPEPAACVLLNIVDAAAGEAIGNTKVRQRSVPQSEQPVVARSNPKAAIAVLVKSPNLVLPKRLHRRVADEGAVAQMADPEFGAYPEVAAAVLQHRPHALVRKTV